VRIASIVNESYVDGPGKRAVVYTQGCSVHCPGCQSPGLWSFDGGRQVSDQDLARQLNDTGLPITISGGEPFDQVEALCAVLEELRALDVWRNIIVYSGYTFEHLIRKGDVETLRSLAMIDVLVDGPYVQELDAPGMQYRGSSNQRVIDVPATLARPAREVLTDGPLTLDWDTPELILTDTGDLLGATPIALAYADIGTKQATRRCGECEGGT